MSIIITKSKHQSYLAEYDFDGPIWTSCISGAKQFQNAVQVQRILDDLIITRKIDCKSIEL